MSEDLTKELAKGVQSSLGYNPGSVTASGPSPYDGLSPSEYRRKIKDSIRRIEKSEFDKIKKKAIEKVLSSKASKRAARSAAIRLIEKGLTSMPGKALRSMLNVGAPATAFAEVFFDTEIAPELPRYVPEDQTNPPPEQSRDEWEWGKEGIRVERAMEPNVTRPPVTETLQDAARMARILETPDVIQGAPRPMDAIDRSRQAQKDLASENQATRREGFGGKYGTGSVLAEVLHEGEAELEKRGFADVTGELARLVGGPPPSREDIVGRPPPEGASPAARLLWYRMGGNAS